MESTEFKGKLIIFSAPSGAGKTTLVHHILGKFKDIQFSVSACSRKRRQGEQNGKDYYFIGAEEFKKKIKTNEFIEWQEVYPNNFYGTLRSEIERIWNLKKHVIFDVDVVGGLNLKKIFGDKALAIFVEAPSVLALEKRLRERETETEESIKRRLSKAESEMSYASQFDFSILNDDIEHAKQEAEKLVADFIYA